MSVASQKNPQLTQRQGPSGSSQSRMCYSFIDWGRPCSVVVTGGCDKVLGGLGWVSFSSLSLDGQLVVSTTRVMKSSQPPSSPQPPSYLPLLRFPPPPLFPPSVYFKLLFFTSLTPLPHKFLQLMHIYSQGHTSTICYSHRVSGRDFTGM